MEGDRRKTELQLYKRKREERGRSKSGKNERRETGSDKEVETGEKR